MKKWFTVILAMLLLLSGCQTPAEDIMQSEPAISEPQPEVTVPDATEIVPTDSPAVYEQQTMFAVSMPLVTEVLYADDGSTIFSHIYQDMQLVLQDPEVADRIIIDYLNRLDNAHVNAAEISSSAQLQYTGNTGWTPRYSNIFFSPQRIDQVVLSLYGTVESYSGDGRPVQVCHAANYNMITGDVLTLGSILNHIDAKAQLTDLVIQAANAISQDKQLFEDYADCITDRFSTEESFDEDWYFSSTGICFYFLPYEIAPYSSGIVTVQVPYTALTGIIQDDFLPPETELTEGTLHTQLLSQIDLADYTQIAELITDPLGESVLLYADGAIRDIRIEVGEWNNDGTEFIPYCTVFAATSLTPHDGIMYQGNIPDTMPQLRISYRSGDEIVTAYLTQSGKDGSIILQY